MNRYFITLYRAGLNMVAHDGVEHAGYMAFMNILSLFPFFVFLISLTGFIGDTQFGIEFINILVKSLPQDFISALKPAINEIISGPPHSLLTISILGAIWTASTSVEGLRTILNKIYNVTSPPPYIFRRILSILQFLAISMIIILIMFSLVFIPIIFENLISLINPKSKYLINNLFILDFSNPLWLYIRDFLILIEMFFVVSILYYVIPNTKISYRSIIPGSLIVVLCWFLTGTILASFLRSYNQVSLIYGSLAGLILSMIFFYIINIIFIYGAEINYLFLRNKR